MLGAMSSRTGLHVARAPRSFFGMRVSFRVSSGAEGFKVQLFRSPRAKSTCGCRIGLTRGEVCFSEAPGRP